MTTASASLKRSLRRRASKVLDTADRVGWRQGTTSLARTANRYWNGPADAQWVRDSHWRDAWDEGWYDIGRRSVEIAHLLARTVDGGLPSGRTIEWGVGGGAIAIHLAPHCREFVAADVVERSLDECERQVRMRCDTPVEKLLISMEHPERAIAELGAASCDLFICFHVMELVPSPDYGLRIVSLAADLLRPGGVAVIQIKYANADPLSRPRRRGYRRRLADMTTYDIDEFWVEAARRGLSPQVVRLVPEDQLDQRYAYLLLIRDES